MNQYTTAGLIPHFVGYNRRIVEVKEFMGNLSIHEGGVRRLKPILMTSLTTIIALVPFLWGNDIGSQLQRPLAVAMIGGMTVGTIVSLYWVPLCYYYLVRGKN